MYSISINDSNDFIYIPGSDRNTLSDIELKLVLGEAGSLTFDMYSNNPYFVDIKPRQTTVSVFRDATRVFYGEVREIKRNIYNTMTVYCVGELAWLHDTIQRQLQFNGSPSNYLQILLSEHNKQVLNKQKFHLGTVGGAQDNILRYANYEDTLKVIREDICDSLGLIPRIRYPGIGRHLDLVPLADYGAKANQTINFGINMMDYAEENTADNLYTAVIPLGAKKTDEEKQNGTFDYPALDAYYTIRKNSMDSVVVRNEPAIATYGYICTVQEWPEVKSRDTLKKYGTQWLTRNQFETLSLTLTAVDLSLLDHSYDTFRLGDMVRCVAGPLGIDVTLPVTELTIYPQAPDKNTLTLGAQTATLTRRTGDYGGIKTDADMSTTEDWNFDFSLDGIVDWRGFDYSGAYGTGPNYWGTGKATREEVILTEGQSGSFKDDGAAFPNTPMLVSGAYVEVKPTHWTDASVRSGPSINHATGRYTFFTFWTNPYPNEHKYEGFVTDNVPDATHEGWYHFGKLPYYEPLLRFYTPGYNYQYKFGTVKVYVDKFVLPWHISDHNGSAFTTGYFEEIHEVNIHWVALSGQAALKAAIMWPDHTSHPAELSLRMYVKRDALQEESYTLVNENGAYIVDHGGNNVFAPAHTTQPEDAIIQVKFGSVTQDIALQDVTTEGSVITVDLSGDGSSAKQDSGYREYKMLEIWVNSPVNVYITDVHVNGSKDFWNANPMRELCGF